MVEFLLNTAQIVYSDDETENFEHMKLTTNNITIDDEIIVISYSEDQKITEELDFENNDLQIFNCIKDDSLINENIDTVLHKTLDLNKLDFKSDLDIVLNKIRYDPLSQIIEKIKLIKIEEIPAITFRGCTTNNDFEYASLQKIIPLRIKDIFESKLVKDRPSIYKFEDKCYQLVKICGVVKSVRPSTKCTTLKIEDGSGRISVIIFDKPDDLDITYNINDIIWETDHSEQMNKNKLTKIIKSHDPEFFPLNQQNEKLYLNSISNIFIKKFDHKQKFLFPRRLQWGFDEIQPHVIILGKVVDLTKRVIFAWTIRKQSNLNEFIWLKHEYFQNPFGKLNE